MGTCRSHPPKHAQNAINGRMPADHRVSVGSHDGRASDVLVSWDISALAYDEINPCKFPLYRRCRSARGSADRIGTGSIVHMLLSEDI